MGVGAERRTLDARARFPDYKVHPNMRMQTRTNLQGSQMPPSCPPTRSSMSGTVKIRPRPAVAKLAKRSTAQADEVKLLVRRNKRLVS